MIVCIEGLDAAGKATHSKLLAERLSAELISFPAYDTELGKAILGRLRGDWSAARECTDSDCNTQGGGGHAHEAADLNPLVLQCLMTVNRLELATRIALCGGSTTRHIVLDRYWLSGLIYGQVDGLDPEWLIRIHALLPQPDLWVLIDVPVEESFRRRPERRDAYEADREAMERRRTAFLRTFVQHAPRPRQAATTRWRVVDGIGTVEEVAARIWAHVEPCFK